MPSTTGETTPGVAGSGTPMKDLPGLLNTLESLRTLEEQKHGASSPEALRTQYVIQLVRKGDRLPRSIVLKSVRRVMHPHALRSDLWRLLISICADGCPLNDPPLVGTDEGQDVPKGVPSWSPWTGLAPPVVPALVQRQ